MFEVDDKIQSIERCQLSGVIIITFNYNTWQLTTFYRTYCIINYKHFNLLVLRSFI